MDIINYDLDNFTKEEQDAFEKRLRLKNKLDRFFKDKDRKKTLIPPPESLSTEENRKRLAELTKNFKVNLTDKKIKKNDKYLDFMNNFISVINLKPIDEVDFNKISKEEKIQIKKYNEQLDKNFNDLYNKWNKDIINRSWIELTKGTSTEFLGALEKLNITADEFLKELEVIEPKEYDSLKILDSKTNETFKRMKRAQLQNEYLRCVYGQIINRRNALDYNKLLIPENRKDIYRNCFSSTANNFDFKDERIKSAEDQVDFLLKEKEESLRIDQKFFNDEFDKAINEFFLDELKKDIENENKKELKE